MCIYVYLYIRICLYIYIYVNLNLHVYVHLNLFIYVYVYEHTYKYMNMHIVLAGVVSHSFILSLPFYVCCVRALSLMDIHTLFLSSFFFLSLSLSHNHTHSLSQVADLVRFASSTKRFSNWGGWTELDTNRWSFGLFSEHT